MPQSHKSLADRVAIVTGSAQGLGAAMAAGLAAAGTRLILTDIDGDRLAATAKGLRESSGNPEIFEVTADISRLDEVRGLVECAKKRFDGIDIIINNAALGPAFVKRNFMTKPIQFWEVDPSLWVRFFEINVHGPLYLEQVAAPLMLANGWGRIINVSTAFMTMLNFDVYGPSKAALEAHTRIISQRLLGTGVTANIIIPGGPADTAQVTEDIGVARESLLAPSVMAPPVVWLCSNEADGTTGQRFSAAAWDPELPGHEAAAKAGRAAAWPELATPIVVPTGANYRAPAN
jgi:3-oxoacyl-[acyl-carrier protein] reductase